MTDKLDFISPEIFISLSIMFLLIYGVFKKNSADIIHYLSIACLLITGILILNNPSDIKISLFNNSYIIDSLSSFTKTLTILYLHLELSVAFISQVDQGFESTPMLMVGIKFLPIMTQ